MDCETLVNEYIRVSQEKNIEEFLRAEVNCKENLILDLNKSLY